jgi:hypothetical protein
VIANDAREALREIKRLAITVREMTERQERAILRMEQRDREAADES